MKNEDAIFEQYALKRLMEDNDLGNRPYLDAIEFNLTHSSSLEFLAKEAGVTVKSAKPKWVTEESDEENGMDYYRDEPERVYIVTIKDIIENRDENMEHILSKFSKSLASKIKAFEKDTKYLYAPSLSSTSEIRTGLRNIIRRYEGHQVLPRLAINHAERIGLKSSDHQQKTIMKTKEHLAKKLRQQNRFYALIKDIHNPQNKNNLIFLYSELLKEVNNRSDEDNRAFLTEADYALSGEKLKKRIAARKGQITTELIRDIYEKLHKLYDRAGNFYKAKDLNAVILNYNDKCKRYNRRLLGPNGAFDKGGFYGPDSKFSGLTHKTENYIQLEIFPLSPKELKDLKER